MLDLSALDRNGLYPNYLRLYDRYDLKDETSQLLVNSHYLSCFYLQQSKNLQTDQEKDSHRSTNRENLDVNRQLHHHKLLFERF